MVHTLTWKLVNDTAETLGVSHEARRKWRQSGRGVPPIWRIKIVEALAASGSPVELGAFDALPETPGRIAEQAA